VQESFYNNSFAKNATLLKNKWLACANHLLYIVDNFYGLIITLSGGGGLRALALTTHEDIIVDINIIATTGFITLLILIFMVIYL
jgi:hypothetical protein